MRPLFWDFLDPAQGSLLQQLEVLLLRLQHTCLLHMFKAVSIEALDVAGIFSRDHEKVA